MTIEKGAPWGEVALPPAEVPEFTSCAALGAHLQSNRTAYRQGIAQHPPEYVLHDAAFQALLGAGRPDKRATVRIPIDVLEVSFLQEGSKHHAIAVDHVMLGERLLRDELALVSNTGFWRSRRIAPRAHPNDGRADVVTLSASMGIRQRLLAWRRTKWGTHLPHPAISVEQRVEYTWQGGPRSLTIDRVRMGWVTSLHVRVVADALTVYV